MSNAWALMQTMASKLKVAKTAKTPFFILSSQINSVALTGSKEDDHLWIKRVSDEWERWKG